MTPEKVRINLQDLIVKGDAVLATKYRVEGLYSSHVDPSLSRQWATNVFALLRSAFGEKSEHYAIAKRQDNAVHEHYNAEIVQSTLRAALDAWDNGYVFEARVLAESTIEASLIDQAEELIAKGYHVAAAVLAGAVLEQHLRSLCAKYGVDEVDSKGKRKMIGLLNDDLRKANAYDPLKHKQITYLGGVRNNAAHGNVVTADDASALVRDAMLLCATLQ
jgi:hypothetical protein